MRNKITSIVVSVWLCGSYISVSSAAGFVLETRHIASGVRHGENREMVCAKTDTPPVIDGNLNDACWTKAEPVSGFLDFGISDFPFDNPDRLIGHQTVVRSVWTKDTIYFGMECLVPDGKMEYDQTSNDEVFTGKEAMEVYLDPGRTRQEYFLFAVNPLGTTAEAKGMVGKPQYGWNAKWTSKVIKEQNKWTVEMAIPLSTFIKQPEPGTEWGINFVRYHTAYHVLSIWSNPQEPLRDNPANFGRIVFAGSAGEKTVREQTLIPPESIKRVAVAIYTDTPPKQDGKLDDPCWTKAVKHTDYISFADLSTKNIPQQTESYYLYDDKNLYVGLRCQISFPHRFQSTKPPNVFIGESVETFWDTKFDRKTHYQLIVNPDGETLSVQKTPTGLDMDWKGDWTVKTTIEEKTWTAEMVVPFSVVKVLNPVPGTVWGHNVHRNDSEYKCGSSFSPPYPIPDNHAVEHYGFLYFVPPKEQLPVMPIEIRFKPGLPTPEPDTELIWGDNIVWVRMVNLAKEDRKTKLCLEADNTAILTENIEVKGGEYKFLPLRARFIQAGPKTLRAVVKTADKEGFSITQEAEVLPLLTVKLASDLYFSNDMNYIATVVLNSIEERIKAKEISLGIHKMNDKQYLKQGNIGKLVTGTAQVKLSLEDLAPGNYVLDAEIISEPGATFSYPFRIIPTPYDF